MPDRCLWNPATTWGAHFWPEPSPLNQAAAISLYTCGGLRRHEQPTCLALNEKPIPTWPPTGRSLPAGSITASWRTSKENGAEESSGQSLSTGGWDRPSAAGLILDPRGPAVDVHLFESLDLRDHWCRLDELEGDGYRRVVTQVQTPDGEVNAYIYVLASHRARRRRLHMARTKLPLAGGSLRGKRPLNLMVDSYSGRKLSNIFHNLSAVAR